MKSVYNTLFFVFLTCILISKSELLSNIKNYNKYRNPILNTKTKKLIRAKTKLKSQLIKANKIRLTNLKVKPSLINNSHIDPTKLTLQFDLIQSQDYKIEGLFVTKVKSCNNIVCPNTTAFCMDYKTCVCKNGFADLKCIAKNGVMTYKNSNKVCEYRQKKQLYAFTLEIFGIGLAHLYLQNYSIFALKLIFALLCLIFLIPYLTCLPCIFENSKKRKTYEVVDIAYLLSFLVWYVIDLVFLGLNKIKDGNGIPLEEW